MTITTPFSYKGLWNCDCHCLLKLTEDKILWIESPDNPGTSVTNAAELLAEQILKAFPHYDRDTVEFYEKYHDEDRIDRVHFSSTNPFDGVSWKPTDLKLEDF